MLSASEDIKQKQNERTGLRRSMLIRFNRFWTMNNLKQNESLAEHSCRINTQGR